MQNPITKIKSLLSKQGISQPSSETEMQTLKDSQSSKYYTSIEDLNWALFCKICITDDLQLLTILGNPTPEELAKAWGDIILEYGFHMSQNVKRMLKEDQRIQMLRAKAMFISTAIYLIHTCGRYQLTEEQQADMQGICDGLNRIYPTAKLNFSKKDKLIAQLKRLESMAKNIQVEIDRTIKGMKPIGEDGKKADYIHFEKMLTNVSIYFKMELDANKLTVLRFITYYKRMEEEQSAKRMREWQN